VYKEGVSYFFLATILLGVPVVIFHIEFVGHLEVMSRG
jgi:hypothetical protein